MKTFLLMGGYGNAGQAIVNALVTYYRHNSDSNNAIRLLIAGRHLDRANCFIQKLVCDGLPPHMTLEGRTVDASDMESLLNVLSDDPVSMIVVASSTTKHVKTVVQAVRQVGGIDYFDVQYSRTKTAYLKVQDKVGLLKEQLWITDGGFHPGLPGAMLRSVCEQGSKDKQAVTEAHVFGLISYNWNNLSANLANETMEEFVVEMKDFEGKVFSDGNWKNQGSAAFFHPITVDFGEPFGNKPCVAMYLDELEDIPCQYPSLRETGFYIAGFHWFIDWFIMPCILLMLIIFPSSQKSTSRLLLRSFQTFCGPPFKTILKTKASTGSSLIVSHKDAYSLTGIPAAATMVQYVQGKFIASKGLNFQASIVATAPFFEDMRQMGASVEVR